VILVDVNTRFNDPGVDINDNSISGFTYNTTGSFYKQFPNGIPTELGNFTIFYQVIDAAGNESNVLGRIVKSIDVHPPVIELIGDPYIIVERWSNYTDQGYTLVGDNYYDNSEITVTTENTVSTLKEGFYHVSYIAEDPSGNVSPTLTRLVKVEHNNTGIEDALDAQEIDIFPNPSSGNFNITLNLPESKQVRISIENVLGKEIRVIEDAIISQAIYQVDLSNESDGVYLIRISTDNEVKTERIILSK
jgi:hypothetical protein